MDKNYTQIPNDILEALYARRMSPLHFQVLLYVIRKTYGFKGKIYDTIAVAKMAKDLGRHRANVSVAVSDLEKMNILEVLRTGSRRGNEMRLKVPSEWEQPVVKSLHVVKTQHVAKSQRQVLRNHNAKCSENATHKRNYTKETIQKKPPISPTEENGRFVPDFANAYSEEEIARLEEEGWTL